MKKALLRTILIVVITLVYPLTASAWPRLWDKHEVYVSQYSGTITLTQLVIKGNTSADKKRNIPIQIGDTIIMSRRLVGDKKGKHVSVYRPYEVWQVGSKMIFPKKHSKEHWHTIRISEVEQLVNAGKIIKVRTPLGTKRRLCLQYDPPIWKARYTLAYMAGIVAPIIFILLIIVFSARRPTPFIRRLAGFVVDKGLYLIIYVALIIYLVTQSGYGWWIAYKADGYGFIGFIAAFILLMRAIRHIFEWIGEMMNGTVRLVQVAAILSAIILVITSVVMLWQENKWIFAGYALVVFRAILLLMAPSASSGSDTIPHTLLDEDGCEVSGCFTDYSRRTFYAYDSGMSYEFDSDESYYNTYKYKNVLPDGSTSFLHEEVYEG